jgi:hypothetical protein
MDASQSGGRSSLECTEASIISGGRRGELQKSIKSRELARSTGYDGIDGIKWTVRLLSIFAGVPFFTNSSAGRTISDSTSNLSVDEQQVTATAKRKEDDAVAAAQAATTTAHREQEALIAVMTVACKTLDEVRAREHDITLT